MKAQAQAALHTQYEGVFVFPTAHGQEAVQTAAAQTDLIMASWAKAMLGSPAKAKPGYISRSAIASPVARVHAIATSMPGAARKDVIAACLAEGIATCTAKTQYQVWFKASKGQAKAWVESREDAAARAAAQ
jgi:hypothetical protein